MHRGNKWLEKRMLILEGGYCATFYCRPHSTCTSICKRAFMTTICLQEEEFNNKTIIILGFLKRTWSGKPGVFICIKELVGLVLPLTTASWADQRWLHSIILALAISFFSRMPCSKDLRIQTNESWWPLGNLHWSSVSIHFVDGCLVAGSVAWEHVPNSSRGYQCGWHTWIPLKLRLFTQTPDIPW